MQARSWADPNRPDDVSAQAEPIRKQTPMPVFAPIEECIAADNAPPSLAQAATLHASSVTGPFELSTYRLLQSHLARGLRVMPLSVSNGIPVATLA